MTLSAQVMRSRFAGVLLGTMVGDQLGAPFEGAPSESVMPELTGVASAAAWISRSRYTDDTQMMIGLAESLAELGRIDGPDVARRFAENYEPDRGYGSGAHRVLAALRGGRAWNEAATLVFPEGSFGNGAAMRVAPVGAFYWADAAERRQAAETSAAITHAHPLGMEGAVLQANAVAGAIAAADAQASAGKRLDPQEVVRRLAAETRADSEPYLQALAEMRRLLGGTPPPTEIITVLGCDIRAQRSVPAAVYSFLANVGSFADAVLFAVRLGGDADTVGAMAGAIAGAFHGVEGIPASWLEALENTVKGRDYVRSLGERLFGWRVQRQV